MAEGTGKVSSEKKSVPPSPLGQKMKEKWESSWLIPESHPARLGIHIFLRGVYAGATVTTLGGSLFLLYKKRSPFLPALAKLSFRGGMVGGIFCGLVAAERLYHLDSDGVGDRSYRLAYNWGQTKWDICALEGGLLGALFLRRAAAGIGPGAAIGTVLGTFAWIGINKLKLF